jgi:aspartate racemase
MTSTIGILAGMGPHSTAPFLELVLAECQAQYGARHDIDFPPIQVLSWPVPFFADRPVDEREVEEATRRGLERLAATGVGFIGIACNTAHAFFPELERSVSVPLLDMVALTADAAPAEPTRIALVAARPTVESGIYQRALEARGHTVLTPPWQDTVDQLIDATRLSDRDRRVRDVWAILEQQAVESQAETILVACADLTAVSGSLATALPVLDSTRLLARGLVRRWLAGRTNGTPA